MTACASQRSRHRLFASSEGGAAGVEFAFILPVLLVGIFAVVEMSRVMYSKVEFEYALFGATRFSSVSKDSDKAKVQKSLSDNLVLLNPANLSPITLSVTPNADKTSTATLTASYKVVSLLPVTSAPYVTLTRSVSYLINK